MKEFKTESGVKVSQKTIDDLIHTYFTIGDTEIHLAQTFDGDGVSIDTNLREHCSECGTEDCEGNCEPNEDLRLAALNRIAYNGMVDGFESLLMSIAGQNVDVAKPEFANAIQNCLEAIGNNS